MTQLTRLLLPMALALPAASAPAQQAAPVITSNLDQASAALSKAPSAVPAAGGPTLLPEDFSKVPLTAGTLLDLRIYRVPEMSGSLRVDEAGQITVPLLGKVDVLGKTAAVLQVELASALAAQGLLVWPQVNVDVLQYAVQSTTVLGEVQMPGRVTLQAPKPLSSVLAMAGGQTIAAGNDIEIQHIGEPSHPAPYTEHASYLRDVGPDSVSQVIVYPGDTVYVRRAGIVYVLGAVNRPGGYLMVDRGSLDLTQVLALAQGTTVIASTRKVWIVRRQQGTVTATPVAYAKVAKGKLAPPILQPEDVVYVEISKLKAAAVNGSAVLSAAASASIYAGIGH
ncbi:MAG TPA: polysaccharide biosynthesis/export family protein [Acidobacteriaceae bacterium]